MIREFIRLAAVIACVAALMAWCSASRAAEIEIGAGISHTTLVMDGFWYQQALPHTLELDSFAWRLGVSQRISEKWSAEISFANNGVQHSDAVATTDRNYDNKNHVCLSSPCLPTARFVGVWSANGVALGFDWRARPWLSMGTAAYAYSPQSEVTTKDYVGYPGSPPDFTYRSSGATHLSTDTHLSWRWHQWAIRGDSYLVCPSNRCKSEMIPPYIGRHLFVLTLNWSTK